MAVTHPESDHVYERVWDDSVAELAEKHDIPVLLRNRPDHPELRAALRDVRPDLIVANNWRRCSRRRSSTSPPTARSTSTTRCRRSTRASPR